MDILKYDNDILFYDKINELYNNGFKIIDGINSNIILAKDNIRINLIMNYNYKIKEIVKPNYNNSILNIISSIRNNYGYNHNYDKTNYLYDKHYKNTIILLLDGLGMNILENNLDKDSFLRKNLIHINDCIYPSTTAASTTSTICGKSVLETGWTGWENYFKEFNKDLVLFTGVDYFTKEQTNIKPIDYIPYKPFYYDMNIPGINIMPDFSLDQDISVLLNKSLALINKYPIQYVYYTEPDGLMHKVGTYDNSVKVLLNDINNKVESYANKLPSDTLLIITADHGHTEVHPINLYKNTLLLNLLERKPSNDSRCITFKVKKGMDIEFERLFNIFYSSMYCLRKSSELIKEGYFGNPNDSINSRTYEFLADYTAMGISNYYFNYMGIDNFLFKSHHAGITKDEIRVPVIVKRK